MLDSLFFIIPPCLLWSHEIHLSGLPLFFSVFASLWFTETLPKSVYIYAYPQISDIVSLTVITDLTQALIHAATHYKLLGNTLYNSHMIHHTVQNNIQPKDAFKTGALDSLTQLIAPIILSIFLVNPNRSSLLGFGLFYSQYLLYIHSQLNPLFPSCFVSPQYHHLHHKNPRTNFCNVIKLF